MRAKKNHRIFVQIGPREVCIASRRTARDVAGAIVGDRRVVLNHEVDVVKTVLIRWVKKAFERKTNAGVTAIDKRIAKLSKVEMPFHRGTPMFANVRFVKAA